MYSKELLKGTLEVIVLKLLSEHGKMYGYELSQKVKEETDGKIHLKDGSLYPALHKMTKDGLLTFEEVNIGKRVRKYYKLTGEGEKQKETLMDEMKDFLQTIEKVIFKDFNMLPGLC
ncbi:MAG: helix-turn-helix transcriptional regulator [Ekhidna sp.]|nr:helix-turn-helix transcriptional regulator [Ekhidna sp.]